MGTLDDNGIYVYDDRDRPAPLHTLLNLGQASVSAAVSDITSHLLIYPVANQAERDAYDQTMRAAGRPPTAAAPLLVRRADTGVTEINYGPGWYRYVDNRVEVYRPPNNDPGWTFGNRVVLKNGHVTLQIEARREIGAWNGTRADFWTALPDRFRPAPGFGPITFPVHNSTGDAQYRSTLFRVNADGSGYLFGTYLNRGNWIYGTSSWPTGH